MAKQFLELDPIKFKSRPEAGKYRIYLDENTGNLVLVDSDLNETPVGGNNNITINDVQGLSTALNGKMANTPAAVAAAIAADPAATREAVGDVSPFLSASDMAGLIPYRIPLVSPAPFESAAAASAITAAGVATNGSTTAGRQAATVNYQRATALFEGLGLWSALEDAYLFGTYHQASSTTLKSITGKNDAAGTSTFSDYYATFNGSSNKYMFQNDIAGTGLTGLTFLVVYRHTGTYGINSLLSNYQGGSTKGPWLAVGTSDSGSGPSTLDNVTSDASIDGTAETKSSVDLGSDSRWSVAALSLSNGVLTTYANSRAPSRASLATAWANNANWSIGASPNSALFFTGDIAFAAVLNSGITDAQWFALKCGLESIFAKHLPVTPSVVFEGSSLMASAPGGGTNVPTKLLALAGWTGVTRSENIAADGAWQTLRAEEQYFTRARKHLAIAGQDSLYVLWSGVNDVTGDNGDAVIASLERTIKRAKMEFGRVAVLTISPVAPISGDYALSYEWSAEKLAERDEINAWIRENYSRLGYTTVDLDEIGDANPKFLEPWDETYYIAGDGLHHNDAGRALIAAKIAAEVAAPSVP